MKYATVVPSPRAQSTLLKALELIDSKLAEKTKHISHGMLRLPSGKMSSRTGDVITGQSLLEDVGRRVLNIMEEREAKAVPDSSPSVVWPVARDHRRRDCWAAYA